MRIVELKASNIKRLKAVAIKPDGSVVQITGANGAGKSSVLDAIFMALAGTKGHPSQPIRKGQKVAKIEVDLGSIIVTRKFSDAGTTLEVARKDDGWVFKKGQTALDSILGELTFDPLAFTRIAPKLQLEQLRGLVKIDLDLDALDAQVRDAYERRADINRRVKTEAERVETYERGIDEMMEVTLIDTAPLLDQMESASAHNASIERETINRSTAAAKAISCRDRAATLRREAEELIREAQAHEDKANAIDNELQGLKPVGEPVDVSVVRRQVADADRENSARKIQATTRINYQEALARRNAAQKQSDDLTQLMADLQASKAAAISAAAMPIDGLSFGDGMVIYNGLPFDQASSAEQLRVAVAIGMAMNPRLRILVIKDGSLLDSKSRATLAAMAEANDFQLWVEVADDDPTAGAGKIIIEDGSIVGAIAPEPELAVAGD